jgi:hypothetical protein
LKNLRRPGSLFVAAPLLLFAIGIAIPWHVVRTGRIPPNSDQAISGLMAKHILEGRGHPVFYYGSAYNGTLEPHFVAGVFALLGVSFASYRVAMGILVLATMASVFLVTLRLFGRKAALVALAYLAVPPFFFLYKGLTSDGVYNTLNLLSLATVVAALWVAARRERSQTILWPCLLLGLAVGLNWWTTPVSTALSAVVLGWLWVRRGRRPGWGGTLGLLGGLAAGSFPWWFWNLRHGWASVKAPELGMVGPLGVVRNLIGLLWTGLPTLAGGLQSTPNILYSRETFPLSRLLTLALLLLLFLSIAAAMSHGGQRQGLFLLALVVLVAAAALPRRMVLSEPRFLFPYYVLVPPLLGAAMSRALTARRTALVAAVTGLAALTLNVCSLAAAPVNRVLKEGEVTGSLKPLLLALEGSGISRVHTDYWTAYRLSFESGERVIASPIPGEEMIRYAPHAAEVAASPDAAVVLLPSRSGCFRAFLEERGPAFRYLNAGSFDIFFKLPAAALEPIRSGKGLPLPAKAYRAAWDIGPQPQRLTAGETHEVRVGVTNKGICVWPPLVRASYHWWALDPGRPSLYDGVRAALPVPMGPGVSATVTLPLTAPPSPGRYRLEYDLVHEGVDWFSTKGGPTASSEVEVTFTAKQE